MNFVPREHVVHHIAAATRFPGPGYYDVLRCLHEDLKPESYVEIGVRRGRSLKLAVPPTTALGIDPFPDVDDSWSTPTRVLAMTSSEFFGVDRFSLAFVDGSHQFEQVIEDIFNLEHYAEPKSIIAVHDTLPLDEKTASRQRSTEFYTGDVWKVIPFLKQHRPDLDLVTVRTGPSGLTLIRRLNPARSRSQAEVDALGAFQELRWDYFTRYRDDFLETIPNQREAVLGWLSQPVRKPT